jgi:hypothetical protein
VILEASWKIVGGEKLLPKVKREARKQLPWAIKRLGERETHSTNKSASYLDGIIEHNSY